MDRRLTPSNGRVAASHLEGVADAQAFVEGVPQAICQPVVDLLPEPDRRRDRQLLMGASVKTYEDRGGWSFIQSDYDGYVGYVESKALAKPFAPTHFVSTAATHAYDAESFKSRDLVRLSLGSRVEIVNERQKVFETTIGFIPKKHLRPLDRPYQDPVTVAQMLFGVPYLWGGNSSLGIDCSGLVSAALSACGQYCPGDSDLQQQDLGRELNPDDPLRRGDLIFWKGHVAMVVDEDTIIHANAHHMAVVYEGIEQATLRIKAQGDGPITARKRL